MKNFIKKHMAVFAILIVLTTGTVLQATTPSKIDSDESIDSLITFCIIADIECTIEQIKEIVYLLNNNKNTFVEHNYISIQPTTYTTVQGNRFIHLMEIKTIFNEANSIMNSFNTRSNTPVIIAGIGEPWEGNPTYGITLFGDEHLMLMDLIIELTGIPEYN